MSGQYLASRCYSLLNDAEATRQSSYMGRPMARKIKWAGWTSAYSAGPGPGPREALPQPEWSFVKTEREKEREWERRGVFCVSSQYEMQANKFPASPHLYEFSFSTHTWYGLVNTHIQIHSGIQNHGSVNTRTHRVGQSIHNIHALKDKATGRVSERESMRKLCLCQGG